MAIKRRPGQVGGGLEKVLYLKNERRRVGLGARSEESPNALQACLSVIEGSIGRGQKVGGRCEVEPDNLKGMEKKLPGNDEMKGLISRLLMLLSPLGRTLVLFG